MVYKTTTLLKSFITLIHKQNHNYNNFIDKAMFSPVTWTRFFTSVKTYMVY